MSQKLTDWPEIAAYFLAHLAGQLFSAFFGGHFFSYLYRSGIGDPNWPGSGDAIWFRMQAFSIVVSCGVFVLFLFARRALQRAPS